MSSAHHIPLCPLLTHRYHEEKGGGAGGKACLTRRVITVAIEEDNTERKR